MSFIIREALSHIHIYSVTLHYIYYVVLVVIIFGFKDIIRSFQRTINQDFNLLRKGLMMAIRLKIAAVNIIF
jgi:hypothetical protein